MPLAIVWFLVGCLLVPRPSSGQMRSAPHDGYWPAFEPFLEGDFRSAAELFREAARDGIVNANPQVPGPWIDAICYRAMLGECLYQMGQLGPALDEFNAALHIFLAHRDWMLRIDFPATIEVEAGAKTPPSWGRSARRFVVGRFPLRYSFLEGFVDNLQPIRRGGVVAPALYRPVYVTEVVRCTALALSRRRTLLGPVAEFDPLTLQLLEALARRPGPPNHWSQCWIELQLGLAYAMAGRVPQAAAELQKALLAADRFEHPLTCVALLELGRLAREQRHYEAAASYFLEASLSAALFERYDVIEEALRLAADSHLLAGLKPPYPPLVAAVGPLGRYRWLRASLALSLAEQQWASGQLAAAGSSLTQARNTLSRHEMGQGLVGLRHQFLNARLAFASGDARQGAPALAAALAAQKTSSPRLLQIGLADGLFRSGKLVERLADQLYGRVLRDSDQFDWETDPLDALAVLSTPHGMAYEHWFELALARKEMDKALQIADRWRRHRFLVTQPLGGRLLALRWLLGSSEEGLEPPVRLVRQQWMLRYPQFAALARQSAELQHRLEAAIPPGLFTMDQAQADRSLWAEWIALTQAQEALLAQMALDRLPAPLLFPPVLQTQEVQRRLPEGTLVLYFLATSRQMYAFSLDRERYRMGTPLAFAGLEESVAGLLRQIGNLDSHQPVAADDLAARDWQPMAARVMAMLSDHAASDVWAPYRELVVVPDGVLWYLPLEMLPVPGSDGEMLLTRRSVRYVPTLGLALPLQEVVPMALRTGIVAGRLLPRDDPGLSRAGAEAIASSLGGATIFTRELPAPSSALAKLLDRWVVLGEHDDASRLPLHWAPLVLDAGKPGSSLAEWMRLPLGRPRQIVLPGFRTAAEVGLRQRGTGEELFQVACSLMAVGCQTVLLSRWRVGGQSTLDLVREFVQELPYAAPAAAWQRSVHLSMGRPLDPALEGRLKTSRSGQMLSAGHPFFWAGYLLLDRGAVPRHDERRGAEPSPVPQAAPEHASPTLEPAPP